MSKIYKPCYGGCCCCFGSVWLCITQLHIDVGRKKWISEDTNDESDLDWKKSMSPVRKVNGGYQYGGKGKLYKGKGAKKKAQKQGRAIQASKRARALGK